MDEDQARQEAEARRQRILNAANNRMDRITGLNRDDDPASNEVAESASADAAAPIVETVWPR